jgi:myo-inositol-1(or 4)-monophosphatase
VELPGGALAAAEAAADLAGAAIRPLFRSALLVEAKGDASPVTEADRAAERAMRGLLRERFPGDGILGEEFGPERADAEWLWVLDPIDGTRAFVTGRPLFGTLIALLHRGRPVLGVIDQPGIGERWVGVAGEPTRFRSPLGGTRAAAPAPAWRWPSFPAPARTSSAPGPAPASSGCAPPPAASPGAAIATPTAWSRWGWWTRWWRRGCGPGTGRRWCQWWRARAAA